MFRQHVFPAFSHPLIFRFIRGLLTWVAWRRHLLDNPSHSKVIRCSLTRFVVTRRPVTFYNVFASSTKDSTGRIVTHRKSNITSTQTRNPVLDVANSTGVTRLRPCPCSRSDQAICTTESRYVLYIYIAQDVYSRRGKFPVSHTRGETHAEAIATFLATFRPARSGMLDGRS